MFDFFHSLALCEKNTKQKQQQKIVSEKKNHTYTKAEDTNLMQNFN